MVASKVGRKAFDLVVLSVVAKVLMKAVPRDASRAAWKGVPKAVPRAAWMVNCSVASRALTMVDCSADSRDERLAAV